MRKFLVLLCCLLSLSSAYAVDPPSCQFTGNVGGSMAVNPSVPFMFGTTVSGGSSAQLYVTYTGSPLLTVQASSGFDIAPAQLPGNINYMTSASLLNNGLYNGGTFWTSGSQSKLLSINFTQDTLFVDFLVRFRSTPPSGNYTASVTVTCQ